MKHFILSLLAGGFFISSLRAETSDFLPVTNNLPPRSGPTVPDKNSLDYFDNLIEATEATLADAKDLRSCMKNYIELQGRFVKNTEDRDLCAKMVNEAKSLLDKIEKAHLTQALDPEMLNELTFLSQMGNKRTGPRPK